LLAGALAVALLWPAQAALADFTQQGSKLVGTGAVGSAQQGYAVAVSANGHTAIVGGPNDTAIGTAWVFTRSSGAWSQQSKLVGSGVVGGASRQGQSVGLSADGNTAIVGGWADAGGVGAAWVFTRSGGVWSQQGAKLVGTGAVGNAQQGISVALSGDGNTAIVGGYGDNSNTGAAWVYTRSGGVWTQQGTKLVGTGGVGTIFQGFSVALSDDGNTAIMGGYSDNSLVGAAWVFTRSGGAWTQQGNKLVGTGAAGAANQGYSVALSGDGNTAVVGGYTDNSNAGAAWVFARSGGVWTQQGSKLVGTGAVGNAQQGRSVGLSGGGNTAIVGGNADNSNAGAAWVFTRSGGVWTQQGTKLVGTGGVSGAQQGWSVALSCDTAVVGGYQDNLQVGAAWVFVGPSTAAHDFNRDCFSDILLQNTGGGIALWLMGGSATVQSAVGIGTADPTVWTVIGQRDINGDRNADIILRANEGSIGEWLMNGNGTIMAASGLGNPTTNWTIVGTGDFNDDGIGDILWRGGGTAVAIWYMNSSGGLQSAVGVGALPNDWTIAGTGDFDGDGVWDILWSHTSGAIAVWLMNSNGTIKSAVGLGSLPPASWSIAGTGDFDGDKISDILFSGSGNAVAIWFMNSSGAVGSAAGVGTMASGWTLTETGDFNGDGKSDILWYHAASGSIGAWLMNAASIASAVGIGALPPATWTIVSANSE
jgi:hypothetical protein